MGPERLRTRPQAPRVSGDPPPDGGNCYRLELAVLDQDWYVLNDLQTAQKEQKEK
jgi:hypothetical protein